MLSRWKSKDKSEKISKTSSSGKKKQKGREIGALSDNEGSRGSRGRPSRRDDPRRHTLDGNHLYAHLSQSSKNTSLDLDPYSRYPIPSSNILLDDDPGIMSEVETASTGFRRAGKQRSSLPVVRTPSKTLERPLGLVFLQYRSETKRALLPNEITSIDTVKALFVRSFSKQLTMQYLDSPMVKIYIHDSNKDMFYELEDVRTHLRDIRDRTVLRLFEATDVTSGVFPGVVGVGSLAIPVAAPSCSGPSSWDQEQSYFSEPEIDSEYHHQHVHKYKLKAPTMCVGISTPSTLPRTGHLLRAFSPAMPPVPADRVKTIPDTGLGGETFMSSPEPGFLQASYENQYYTQYLGPVSSGPEIGSIINEDTRMDSKVDDIQRLRVEKMERQLANLTGLVQKALQAPGTAAAVVPHQDFAPYATNPLQPPQEKSVSVEKSVSFSDDPPDMNSPKQHSPQHSERDRLKPAPPPKPAGLAGQPLPLDKQRTYTINVAPDFFYQLRLLQKQSQDLRLELENVLHITMECGRNEELRGRVFVRDYNVGSVNTILALPYSEGAKMLYDLTRNLRRSTLSHAMQMRQIMVDTILKIGALAASFCIYDSDSQLAREQEIYRHDMLLLENTLYELESTVEGLRGQAANRETRVNMADIERIAMVLSKSSKTVADWKLKFPILRETMKVKLASEMEKVVRKEKILEEEPERLELALRRCKKLTGTLVTLKRLACVQEQRLPLDDHVSPSSSSSNVTGDPFFEEFSPETNCHPTAPLFPILQNKDDECGGALQQGAKVRPENALDALLDELQTFAKPGERCARAEALLRRLHSYPSGSDTDASPPVHPRGRRPIKPPIPERHPELLALTQRRAPPPLPPRTTSRSPLLSPTSTSSTSPFSDLVHNVNHTNVGVRQVVLEQRHQELLMKQKALQEQYFRLQNIQRTGPALLHNAQPDLRKSGSESNLLSKMNLKLTPSTSGSLTHLATEGAAALRAPQVPNTDNPPPYLFNLSDSTTNKVYETDIL